eukprot:Phypoly_transcript_04332.p1 GENE.Phypoly_transcript_04332~~Phypoly_transcript_04332.p1  ORF type:complete len:714 (-),score=121.16 Phypoly_transcript_04332:26-2167(-)
MGRFKLTHICWAISLVFLIILISLVGYQVHLTRKLSHNVTPNSNSDDYDYSMFTKQITSAMDFSANPCNDFYQYSCGALIDQIVLPPGVNMYIPVFNEVEYDNYIALNDIVNDQWPLINDLYVSCMSSDAYLTADTINSLKNYITVAQAVNASNITDVQVTLAALHRMGVQAFFVPSQQENIFQFNSTIDLILYDAIWPYDLSQAGDVQDLATDIYGVVSSLTNFTQERATNVANMEATIQAFYTSPTTFEEAYVNMTWTAFQALVAPVDYTPYVNAIGLPMTNVSTVVISTPGFLMNVTKLYSSSNPQTIEDYLVWRVLYSLTDSFPVFGSDSLAFTARKGMREVKKIAKPHSFINRDFLRPHLEYATQFTTKQLTCIDSVDQLLGDFLGLIFSMEIIDDAVTDDVHTVTGGIQNSFKNNLAGLTWIDSYSKAQAAYKLSNILQIIGHPNKLDRYRGLLLDPTHFLDNIVAIQSRVFDYDMMSVGTIYNRSQNEFPATIVNAFYNPEANTINFPAGILESPMFSTSFPMIMQYARMGYVIGHETTHGFDNNGRMWNSFGVYEPIMDDNSSDAFNERAQCIVNQYNQFQPVPGYFVNGEQTLGENIADIGGVKNAFLAYEAWVKANGTANLQMDVKSPLIPQLTNEQAFFVVMAQTWCTKATTQGIIAQLQQDEHSPSQFRVNGPLANLQEFADAFSCPKNSPMNPTNKCELW